MQHRNHHISTTDVHLPNERNFSTSHFQFQADEGDKVVFMNIINRQWFSGKVLSRFVRGNLILYNILSDHSQDNHGSRVQSNILSQFVKKLNSTVGTPCTDEEIAPLPVDAKDVGAIVGSFFAVLLLLLLIAGAIYLIIGRTKKKRLK